MSFALLGLLHRSPATGYEVMQIFKTTPIGGYSSSPGALYPALRKLKTAGLVAAQETKQRGNGARLSLTAKGRETLMDWARRLPSLPDHGNLDLAEDMLRFTFMGDLLTPREQIRFLEALAEAISSQIEMLCDTERRLRNDLQLHDRLALRGGIMRYEAERAWVRDARRELSGHFRIGK